MRERERDRQRERERERERERKQLLNVSLEQLLVDLAYPDKIHFVTEQ